MKLTTVITSMFFIMMLSLLASFVTAKMLSTLRIIKLFDGIEFYDIFMDCVNVYSSVFLVSILIWGTIELLKWNK